MNQLRTAVCFAAAALFTICAAPYCQGQDNALIKFGVITDIHHTNKPDTLTRKYSAALNKSKIFIATMKQNEADFIIELGDFVDTVTENKDPATNLAEIVNEFSSFNGPVYHVLGNHDFDSVTREMFLSSVSNTGIGQGQTYYSWDNGGVHFVVLDADYTNEAPHRPFGRITQDDTFWDWRDAFVPEEEIQWLIDDLAENDLPTVIFTHQTLDRVDDQDHNINNGSRVREILERDGQVIAVFSGHDHQGGYANIKDIHYIVLNGNVGVNDFRPWSATSQTEGFDVVDDNQFVLVEISQSTPTRYTLTVNGFGRQPSYRLKRDL